MPCYDSRSDPGYIRAEAEAPLKEEIRRLKTANQKLEAMLCGLMCIVSYDQIEHEWNAKETGILLKELWSWWAKHKARDAKRRK